MGFLYSFFLSEADNETKPKNKEKIKDPKIEDDLEPNMDDIRPKKKKEKDEEEVDDDLLFADVDAEAEADDATRKTKKDTTDDLDDTEDFGDEELGGDEDLDDTEDLGDEGDNNKKTKAKTTDNTEDDLGGDEDLGDGDTEDLGGEDDLGGDTTDDTDMNTGDEDFGGEDDLGGDEDLGDTEDLGDDELGDGTDDTGDTDGTDTEGETDDPYGDETEENPDEKLKIKKLKIAYKNLYNDINEIRSNLNRVSYDYNELQAKTLYRVTENLTSISDTLFDYIINLYDKKTYYENLYHYQYIVKTVKITTQIMEKIKEMQNKD